MSREMTAAEERYWVHALSGDPLIGDYLRKQGMYGDWRKLALSQPICPRCERMAFHHKHGVACPSCCYQGPAEIRKLRVHLREGGYR